MSEKNNALMNQVTEAVGNIQFTYMAHWNIVNRLKKQYWYFKVTQIVLTALSVGGFFASLISGISKLSWIGGLTSSVALGINLYMLNFNLPDNIKQHTDAANELWEVREQYKSLIVDFDDIEITEVRKRRDELIKAVSNINKKYPGTDAKSFKEAQDNLINYTFDEGEAAKAINMSYGTKKE